MSGQKTFSAFAAYTDNVVAWINGVTKTQAQNVSAFENLKKVYLTGRNRTDHTAPAAFNDVVDGVDLEGDWIFAADYFYRLTNDAGTLKWARIPVDVAW